MKKYIGMNKISLNKGKSPMTISKLFCRYSLALAVLVTFALSYAPAFAEIPVTGPEGHLKQSMECEWAVLNPTANPEDYINDPNDDLVKLAESLDNDPIKIYNWVYKNIYFPKLLFSKRGIYYYQHSRLGARGVFLNKIGNHWDQSSLLIALLRISKIPARYVKFDGTDLVYVEAWMEQDNYYSGAGAVQKDWVPLMPWLKEIDLKKGDDLFKDLVDLNNDPVPEGLDFDFPDYLSSVKYKSALELYENQIQEYVTTNKPGKTLKDIATKEKIIDHTGSILPRSLPKELGSFNKIRFIEPFNDDRESIRIQIIKTVDEVNLLDYTLYLPQVAGKRFALDWIYTESAFTPQFKIEGVPVLTSGASLAKEDSFYIKYRTSSSGDLPRPSRIAGTYIHMGFDPLSASVKTIEKAKKELQNIDGALVLNPSTHEEYLGLMGTVFVETFLNRMYENTKRAEKYFSGIRLWSLSPTFIYTKYHSEEHPILTDQESKFYYHPQWNIDAQSSSSFFKWDETNENFVYLNWDAPVHKTFRLLTGYGASYDEGRIFEDWMETPGASTIRGLMVANEDLQGTGNRMMELVEADIQTETDPRICGFENIRAVSENYDMVYPYEAFDGFHFQGLFRVPDGWSNQGFTLNSSAVDGSHAIAVRGSEGAIMRGTLFDFNSVKVSALLDGASYRFTAYSGKYDTIQVGQRTVTVNHSPQVISFNWQNVNKVVITAITTNKGPVVLENLNYTRKEYLPEIENQTELHLGYSSVITMIEQLRDGGTVVTPIQVVNYAGLSGDIRIVHSSNSDLYSFGMDNGGASSPWVDQNYNYTQPQATLPTLPTYITDITSQYSTIDYDTLVPINYQLESSQSFAADYDMGDPVNMVTGEYYQKEKPDMLIKSIGFNLGIERKYKSRLSYNGPFGYGWTWNHAQVLIQLENDELQYYNEDSEAITIKDLGDGTYEYPSGCGFTLERVDDEHGAYRITEKQTQEKIYFSADGLLAKKIDRSGNALTFNYTDSDNPSRIIEIEDSLGRKVTLTYGENGKVSQVTDFAGRYSSYVYSGDDLVEFHDLEGNVTTYEYLSDQENVFNNHNMSKYILPNGDWLEIGYFKNDTVAYHTNKKGETFNFMFSRLNRYSETWNEEGYYRKIFFNENNDVVRSAMEDGIIELMEYDDHHNKISHTDGNGNTTTFQFYPDGTAEADQEAFAKERKLYKKTNALGHEWQYKYDSPNNLYAPSEIIEAEGNITRFVYNPDSSLERKIQAPGYIHDEDGNLVVGTPSDGFETLYVYDANGNVTRITSPDGSFIQNTYDANNLYLTASQDKNGNSTTYEYFETCGSDRTEWIALGALKSKTVILEDESSLTTQFEYNLYGQIAKQTDPLGEFALFEYDVNRKLIKKTDADGAETLFEYDTARDIVSGAKLIKMTDPEGNIETYQYDKVGNQIAKTDKNGNATQYLYDEMNRLTGELDALGLSQWVAYDGAGNVVTKTDKNGNTTTFEYDSANRLVKATTPEGVEHGYFSTIEYDTNGNKILETDAEGIKTQYEYDILKRIISKTTGFESLKPRTTEYRYNALNQLVSEIQPLGNFTKFEYDTNGNLTAQETYDKDGTTLLSLIINEYYADARNLLKSKTLKDGFQTEGENNDMVQQYQYDALGRKTVYTDPNGGIAKYKYDAAGNLVQVTDPAGNITTHAYDKNKRQIRTTNALGHTASVQYDGVGNVALTIDALGNETRYFYDAANRRIGTQNALDKSTILDYDANGNLLATTDPKGNFSQVEYDKDNRVVKQIDALGQESFISYYPSGRVNEKTSPRGIVTQMIYDDPSGQVTSVIQAKGSADETITDYTYDDNGLLEQETNALGIATSYIYDGLGRLLSKINGQTSDGTQTFPVGAGVTQAVVESYTYYSTGKIKTYTDPKIYMTAFEYDALGNKSKYTDPLGNVTRWNYDKNANLLSVNYPDSVTDTYEYDAINRVILKNEQGVETRYIYDANNQVISQTNGVQVDTVFVYDGLNRLVEKTQGLVTADQSTSRFGYDSNSNIVFITNSLGKTIFYTYDSLNRRIEETKAQDIGTAGLDLDNLDLSGFVLFKSVDYDDNGNVSEVTKADNSQIQYGYDDMDRNITVQHNGILQQEFTYDVLSRMTWSSDINRGASYHEVAYENYNLLNLPSQEIQNGRVVGTAYDDNANLTGIQYSSGKAISQTYTDNNQIASIVNTGENITLAQMTDYNGLGSLKEMTFGNGVTISLDYDAHNREELRSYEITGTSLYDHQIQTRDDQGNITNESITTLQGSIVKSHDYDALDRITESIVTNKSDITWSYDTEGNWTETTQNGAAETRQVDNDNQYTTITGQTPDYDANGNMTSHNNQTLVYDWADRLVQVHESGSLRMEYFYDALNRRVRKMDNTTGTQVVTDYVYNGSQVIEEYKDNLLDKTFVYADYMDDPIAMTSGANRYYFIKDRQFNIKAVTDDAGNIVETYEYSAYGVMTIYNDQGTDITGTGSAIGNPYGYTGRRWDSDTGLWYYRNRMYSPSMGRFMQKDPAGYVDGLNLYAYVMNNPLMYVDPMGLTAYNNLVNSTPSYEWDSTPSYTPSYDQNYDSYVDDFNSSDVNSSFNIGNTNDFDLNDVNQADPLRSGANNASEIIADLALASAAHAPTTTQTNNYEMIDNCLGVSDEAYQQHLRNMENGIDFEKIGNDIEFLNNAVITPVAFVGLFFPPTTVPSASVLTASTVGGVGIDAAQMISNPSDENLEDFGWSLGSALAGTAAARGVLKVANKGFERLPNKGAAFQVVKETKMYRFVSDSFVKTSTRINSAISTGIGLVGKGFQNLFNSPEKEK